MKINKRVIQSGYEGFAFPKMKTVKVKPEQVNKMPEEQLQNGVDQLLQANHLSYLRLPSNMFRAIHADRNISNRMKAWILHELSGFADNMIFKYLCQSGDVHIGLVCHIENKSETGKLHGKQKIRSKELGFNECRSLNDAIHIINGFNKFHQFFSQMLKQYADRKKRIEEVGNEKYAAN